MTIKSKTKSSKKLYVKMKCEICKNINYYIHKSKQIKHIKEKKLSLRKFCKNCRKTIKHNEVKK